MDRPGLYHHLRPSPKGALTCPLALLSPSGMLEELLDPFCRESQACPPGLALGLWAFNLSGVWPTAVLLLEGPLQPCSDS